MPTPLKEHVNQAAVQEIAAAIHAVEPAFSADSFVADATADLASLELKARVDHVASALAQHLPGPFPNDARVLCAAARATSFTMWTGWPCVTYVERYGLDHSEAALDALAGLTPYASAEFAIRPYLEHHPELTWERLHAWARSDDLHLRRLASEGTRPRLPWGRQLRTLRTDPSPTLPLLDLLREDPEEYVRRSVANHLNDISKDHPELAIAVAQRWQREGGVHVRSVVRHAMRDLVKAGLPEALSLVGAEIAADVRVHDLHVATPTVLLGESLQFSFTLVSHALEPVQTVIDYVVHHQSARGELRPKVFKLSTRMLVPGERASLTRAHAIRPITTRRYYPGAHRLEIQVNGRRLASADFELRL